MATPTTKGPGKTPFCFTEFLKLRAAVEGDTAQLNSITGHVSALQDVMVKAREKFFATLSIIDFKSWAAARAEFFSADPCSQEFSRTYGALGTRAAGTDEASRIVTDCLREMKAAMEKQIAEFRSATAELVSKIFGTETGSDHPQVVSLQQQIAQLNEAVDQIENSDHPPEAAWKNHNARILDWLRLHEPGLLGLK